VGDQYLRQHNNDLGVIISKLGHEAMAQWIAERRPDLNQDAHSLALELEQVIAVGEREKQAAESAQGKQEGSGDGLAVEEGAVIRDLTQRTREIVIAAPRDKQGRKYYLTVARSKEGGLSLRCETEEAFKQRMASRDLNGNRYRIDSQEGIELAGLFNKLNALDDDTDLYSISGGRATLWSALKVIIEEGKASGTLGKTVLDNSNRIIYGEDFDFPFTADEGGLTIIPSDLDEGLLEKIMVQLRKLGLVIELGPKKGVLEQKYEALFMYALYNLTGAKRSGASNDEDGTGRPTGRETMGGIDFRALPIVTQAVSNLRAQIGASGMGALQRMNLSEEWGQIEQMVSGGIIPSSERIKEFIQASCAQGNAERDIEKVISCISDILRQEEESCCSTDNTLRDILVVLEATPGGAELSKIFLRS